MDNKEFGKKLESRTKNFAISIITELNWMASGKTQLILSEAKEILAIFTSIAKTLKL